MPAAARPSKNPYSIFSTPLPDKHIANLALFVRLQVPWSKPAAGIESGFVADASAIAKVPHLLFGELAGAGRGLLRSTDEWEKWLRACADSEVSHAEDAFARPEDVEYGEAAVRNNKGAALLLEGNPRRAKSELIGSMQLQRRNEEQPWGATRPAAALEQTVTLLNLAATEAMLGEYEASGRHASSVAQQLQDAFPKLNATIGTLLAVAAFYSGCAELGAKWSATSLQTERIVAARSAAGSLRTAALLSRQWAGAKGDLAKKMGTARRKLDRKVAGTWQESKGASNAAATDELYALGMPPVSVSAALSASSLAEPSRRRSSSSGGLSGSLEHSGSSMNASSQLWASGSLPSLSSLGSGAAERALHALEHRDSLASRAQRRARTRQGARHEVTVELPLSYSASQWKSACKTAAAELMKTGLRYEQVDLSFNPDPSELQHSWAVMLKPQRKELPEKREAQLHAAVMGALKTDWRKRMGTYKERAKPPEKPAESSSDSDDDVDAPPPVPGLSGAPTKGEKSFKQMEKELRKRLEAASPEELCDPRPLLALPPLPSRPPAVSDAGVLIALCDGTCRSKMFFTAMVSQDQDMIRRLLSQEHIDVNATNIKGETAMDVARDRGKLKSLEVIAAWKQRQDRKKYGRGGKAPGELSTEHLNLDCSPEVEQEIVSVFKQFDRDGDGTIDLEELGTVFVSMGQELNDRELQKVLRSSESTYDSASFACGRRDGCLDRCYDCCLQMMNEMDLDNTGSVEFDEFAVVMAKKMTAQKRK